MIKVEGHIRFIYEDKTVRIFPSIDGRFVMIYGDDGEGGGFDAEKFVEHIMKFYSDNL